MELNILDSFCGMDNLSLFSCKDKSSTQLYMSGRSYWKCAKHSDKLTANRTYFQPEKGCNFLLHSCVRHCSLPVAQGYMERLVGVGEVSKVFQ